MNPILDILAAHRDGMLAAMLPVIPHRFYHDLRAMLPSDACRTLLWDHVLCRNLWNEFESALRVVGLHESVWQEFFAVG